MPADFDDLEIALGYRFRNRALLEKALTHSSIANEIQPSDRPGTDGNNERLEFLGDSVLGWVVSEWLFRKFPSYTEGQLSLVKNHLVSALHLLNMAHKLDLGLYLRLGRGVETGGGRGKHRLLANAVEALLAAIYLDAGLEEVRAAILNHAMPDDAKLATLAGAGPPLDFRAELDRVAREKGLPRPMYVITAEYGPGHARTFTVEARVGKEIAAVGEGSSKKVAAHNAAQSVCKLLRGEGEIS